MAGGMDLGGRPPRRALDAPINLVPFIDLMAVTISFLMLTAVWTQLGRLEVRQEGRGEGQAAEVEPLQLLVGEREVRVAGAAIPLSDEAGLLAAVKREVARRAGPPAATVQVEDGVRYEALVKVLDACAGAGVASTSVAPAG